jgi:hypothetical protein
MRAASRARATSSPLGVLNIYLGHDAGLGTTIAPTWIPEA